MLWQTVLASSLAAAGVQAVPSGDMMTAWGKGSAALDKRVEPIRDVGTGEAKKARQPQTTLSRLGSNTPMRADGSVNMETWDVMAEEACTKALRSVDHATNPSGVCVCYNLPVLDKGKGAFEAELRVFHLDPPTGDFAGVRQEDMQVALAYRGASVSPISPGKTAQKVMGRQAENTKTDTNRDKKDNKDRIHQLKTYLFVGQLDRARMSSDLGMAQIEAMVLPTVTISAVSRAGHTVSTNVSSNEAAFVAGVYSQSIVLSPTAKAQLAVDRQVRGLRTGTVAFVLPGTRILIFPIGLIITGAWTVIAVAVYAAGTVARMNFRESYRRRVQRAVKGTVTTI